MIAVGGDAGDTLEAFGLQGLAVGLAVAGDAHGVDVFPDDTVLLDELVKAVGVAGL